MLSIIGIFGGAAYAENKLLRQSGNRIALGAAADTRFWKPRRAVLWPEPELMRYNAMPSAECS